MAFGNWTDNRDSWVDKTPFATACAKLDDMSENNHALIKEETFANWGRDEEDPFTSQVWGVRAYIGLTLYGDEPYDNIVFAIVCAGTEENWPAGVDMDVWFRIYNVERAEYYPDATGISMWSIPFWPLGFPFPGYYFQTKIIEASLTPPAGAWSPGSYELQLQTKYSPSATQRFTKMRGLVGILERS
jgi:hypothetical protein